MNFIILICMINMAYVLYKIISLIDYITMSIITRYLKNKAMKQYIKEEKLDRIRNDIATKIADAIKNNESTDEYIKELERINKSNGKIKMV